MIDRMPRIGDRVRLSTGDRRVFVITERKGGGSAIFWAMPEGEEDLRLATCFIAWFPDGGPAGTFNQLVSFA